MEALAAHSGKQYLISFFNDDTTIANDDWLISSEVSADKSISFYAKTLSINPAKRNVLDLKNETCKNREKRNVLKNSHTRYFKAIKKQSVLGCFHGF